MITAAPKPEYPERPQFYVLKLIDAIQHHACDLGREVAWLLTVIARTEDRLRYSGPVKFWNKDLMSRAGMRSKGTFCKARDKAVELGWLAYRPGSRSRAASYFTMIPDGAESASGPVQTELWMQRATSGPVDTSASGPANPPDADHSPPSDRNSAPASGPPSALRPDSSPTCPVGVAERPVVEEPPKPDRQTVKNAVWRTLQHDEIRRILIDRDRASFEAYDADGIRTKGWAKDEVSRRQRLALWFSCARKARQTGGNAAALLKAAMNAGRMEFPDAACDDQAILFLKELCRTELPPMKSLPVPPEPPSANTQIANLAAHNPA